MLVEMWRNIIGQVAYQMLVMVVLSYFGGYIFFDEPFNLIFTDMRDQDGNPTSRMVLDTIMFHTFILMNLFN
jgi:hypothetical protein